MHGTQRIDSVLRMVSHDSQLIGIERAWLFEDGQRNACLADIVKHSGKREPLTICMRHADVLPERHGQSGHDQAMLIGLAMVHADRLDPRGQALHLDLVDDRVAGLLDRRRLDRPAHARRGKYML